MSELNDANGEASAKASRKKEPRRFQGQQGVSVAGTGKKGVDWQESRLEK